MIQPASPPDKPRRTVDKPKPKPRPTTHAWRATGILIPDPFGNGRAVRDFVCTRCNERRGVVDGLTPDAMRELLRDMRCRCRP